MRPGTRVDPAAVIALADRILKGPARRQPPAAVSIEREIGLDEHDQVVRARRDAWTACVLRRAYDTGWLPADTVRNIRRILPAADGSRVDLWLWTGARIIDTCDRITVHGPVDAIAVHELVAAVQRRAWSSVIVTGSEEFKRAVAIGMAMAQPPGEVVNYVIPNDDQECITQRGHAS